MSDVALTPRIWTAHAIETKSCELAASNFVDFWHLCALDVLTDALWVPVGFHIIVTCLSVDAKAPSVELTLICQGGCVTEAS